MGTASPRSRRPARTGSGRPFPPSRRIEPPASGVHQPPRNARPARQILRSKSAAPDGTIRPYKRSTMQLLDNTRKAVSDFRQLIVTLTSAVKASTAATVEATATAQAVLDSVQNLEATAQTIQAAATYLERADRFTRRSSGHEVPHV